MQRAYAEADEVVAQAQQQAQEIIDSAVEDANSIRQSSVNYTDDMLRSLQTIIAQSMEEAQGRFEAYFNSMQSSYDIVMSNRNELAAGVSVPEDEMQAAE